MAAAELSKVIEHLRTVLVRQDAARMTDGDLLQRYLQHRDEAAFEAIVRRRGPMVLAVFGFVHSHFRSQAHASVCIAALNSCGVS